MNTKQILDEYGRLVLLLGLVVLFLTQKPLQEIILGSMSEAYINVGVFVAATLFIYYFAEKIFGFDITKLKEKSSLKQISIASALGALPGCGGAIIVVSQYASGHIRFSSFVAALISTMGDAAFLLLAKKPEVGFFIIGLGFVVGVLTGLIIDFFHSKDFLMQSSKTKKVCDECEEMLETSLLSKVLWMMLFFLAIPMTLLSSFQVEISNFSFLNFQINPYVLVGSLATFLGFFMWALFPFFKKMESKRKKTRSKYSMTSKVINDTNFIIVWVLFAFLLFEIFIFYTGISLDGLFENGRAWLAPLVGIAIGLIPGCGPQIIVASLYLQGIIPFSALVGNAISNDGDALFPALALTPKAAIVATLYSTIPAFLISYSIYFFA